MINISKEKFKEIVKNSNAKNVAVIGDVMLDRYFWGSVARISPEAPVPVVDVSEESFHLGGAANVAANIKSLGMNPLLCGLLGDDNSGKTFKEIANNEGINTEGLYFDANRPTTVKTRIIGNNQQLLRLDREIRKSINDDGEKFIINFIQGLDQLAAVIFEDYNKGVISSIMIREIINYCKKKEIPVFVDPKFDHFFEYRNSTVFKPNKKEAQAALNMKLNTKEDVLKAGQKLLKDINCDSVLLTLGADGMMLFEKNGEVSSVPTRALHVADVSGAGDTGIATMAMSLVGGGNFKESAALANIASGIVCESPGIVSVKIEEIENKLN